MPETIGEAFVAIRPDTQGFGQKLESGITPGLAGIGKVIGGLFAVSKVSQFFGSAIDEANEAAKVGAQTEAVLKSTGNAANITADEIDALSGSLSDKAAVDDEVIQSGANMLLTFKNIRNEAGKGNDIFNQATKATLDMAAGMAAASGGEVDLKGASIQLGKALNDPIAGISALTRVGVQFTDQQKEQIKALVESGHTMEAQKIILREVNAQFAGSAEAQATALGKASVAWANFQEAVGQAIAPVVGAALEGFTDIVTGASDFTDVLGDIEDIAPAVALGITAIGFAVNSALGVVGLAVVAGLSLLAILKEIGVVGSGESSKGIKDTSDRISEMTKNVERLNGQKLIEFFTHAAEKGDGVQKRIGGAGKELGLFLRIAEESPAAASKLLATLDLSASEYDVFSRALDRVIGKKREEKAATDAVTQSNEDLLKSVQDVHDQTLALAGGELGYQQAVINVEKAQTALNEAVKEYGPFSNEARDATLSLGQAQVSAAQSANDLDKDTKEMLETYGKSPGSIQAEIDKLEEAKRQHPEIAASYDPILDKLVTLRDYLNRIPEEIRTRAEFESAQALADLAAYVAHVEEVTGLSYLDVQYRLAQSGVPGYASGGWASGTFLVGERGPELLSIGAQRGYVTNAQDTARMTGTGPTFNVNVSTPEPVTDTPRFTRSLMRGLRSEAYLAGMT